MGYALFTARKLMLQNRINQMNYRMMVLSQQQQDLASKQADLQMQNGWTTMSNSIFNSNAQVDLYNNISNAGGDQTKLTQLINDAKTSQNDRYNQQLRDSAQSTAQLQGVAQAENQIDLEMKKLETLVKAATSELEQVEKAEDSAIKAAAPKYGAQGG